ncbi:uncharacterized protein F5147DRAFT_762653 [Suillus discolor]|uniref:Uncharacterized protein n=1 Tax=Suillus discolor TaxID=1912936 RepID=A0A9P7F2M0_9AGAM|nr:uncharacterized protein F5147DRAFT_762653 [Suillus discolor]KAG2101582.1 hypothetical protein F5147DRAFT_762653 [Suillus discolor]
MEPTPNSELELVFDIPDNPLRLDSIKIREAAVMRPDGRVRIPRKPRKDASITPSTHRPHILASDRVFLWTTPHGFDHQHELEQLFPESDILKMFFILTQSLDESTRSNYGAGLLRFTQYCDKLHIPETQCMPASNALLSAFIAASAGSISDSTASNWLAGLHFWHIVNGAQWHGTDSPLLHHMKRGLTRLVPPNLKRAQRPPVTLDTLVQLGQGLNLSNSFDVAIFAIACVSFWSCCRLGELLIPSPNTFDAIKHVSRSILPIITHNSHNQTAHGHQ